MFFAYNNYRNEGYGHRDSPSQRTRVGDAYRQGSPTKCAFVFLDALSIVIKLLRGCEYTHRIDNFPASDPLASSAMREESTTRGGNS